MRRLLTTLVFLLVVLVAGLSALVLLVNPNDFRAYMVRQVEIRSGYQLHLAGPLRWHVWPQLSILSGRMSLTAPGADQPLVRADNMRLDVALLPLLSHQLKVQQVMLKGAVIELTPQTEERRPKDAPIGPATGSPVGEERGWSFDIAQLKVADSVLVFQHDGDEQITVRDINLQMEQNDSKQARIELSSRVNRDQRDLNLSLAATLDASQYPRQLTATISKLDYQLKGADLPPQGIMGSGTFIARWLEAQRRLELNQLRLTANDSDLQGNASVVLEEKPQWAIDLRATKLDLDGLVAANPVAANGKALQHAQSTLPRPVIAAGIDDTSYQNLRAFNARVNIAAANVRWRGLEFTDVQSRITNEYGLLTVAELAGKFGSGSMSLPGVLDARNQKPQLNFSPKIEDVEIGPILSAFNYPIALSGLLSMKGDFSGDRLNAEAFRRSWQGAASITMANTRMQGMNFQQLIQQAVTRSNGDVQAQETYDNVTTLDSFSAQAALNNGDLTLNNMAGKSSMLDLTGQGTLNLVDRQCDTRFNVTVLGGWQGDGRLIEVLKSTPIPLRVYGPWQKLNYSLQVDQALRKQLQGEAKRRLNDWLEKHKDSGKSKEVKELLNQL
ncbi:outer membrane assembly protein AsmA [Buttiauxella warmboldiae]|uniref:Outer membrane assembly protein AsmA n=1 Tax=Buttiauxella warmboldiae TaxID=82993 RepID=A0A3N5D1C6_9ENTR|nr:outer membrane assembly protein AsmA [Buttiauxella warmboldiae]RPH19950.1 outer membrane assembly protein AsmA [Buttiauxella warmboldiae]